MKRDCRIIKVETIFVVVVAFLAGEGEELETAFSYKRKMAVTHLVGWGQVLDSEVVAALNLVGTDNTLVHRLLLCRPYNLCRQLLQTRPVC